MDILTAENAIVIRIKEYVDTTLGTDLSAPIVKSFPRNPAQYFKSINTQGEILVRFNDALGSEPIPNRKSVTVQDFTPAWSIWIVNPNLVTHTGVYVWIDKVLKALIGWTIPTWDDSTPLYCTNVQFIDEQNGKWFYELFFSHQTEESEI